MKTLRILGASLLVASLGFVGTAPVSAAEVAVSMSAIMSNPVDTPYVGGDAINSTGGILSTPGEIKNLSVSAVVGSGDAMAGGFTNADSASSIAGAGLASGTLTATGVTLTTPP